MNKSDTILVTGAGGLVGSAVVEHLNSLGFTNVWGLTRADCDLLDIQATRALFERIQPDQVFHAAALVFGMMGNMNNQGRSFFENTLINVSVIDAAKRSGVGKIIAMGTNAAYPFPPVLPFKESSIFDGRPHHMESAYAHAKRGMLAMLEAYEESYGIDWAYLISCNLFGPHDTFDTVSGHVVPSLIRKFYVASISDMPVVVWGDGSARRDFLYVKDLARFVHMVMDGPASGAFNVAAESMTIRELVEILSRITRVTEVLWDKSKPNGQEYRKADLSRLAATGFTPAWSIESGLRETWKWYCLDQVYKGGHEQTG